MVRCTSSLFVFLPEPKAWAEPTGTSPAMPTEWLEASSTPLRHGPVRALVVLEVKEFDFFRLGTTHVVDVDRDGALVQHCGADVVKKLRDGLRNPPKYPSLAEACSHVTMLLFGHTSFYMRSFEALIEPANECAPPWDIKLLGRHTHSELWHGTRQQVAISLDLACCAVTTRRDTVLSDGLRVPVMMLQPFVPCDMDEATAMQTVRDLMHRGKHKARRSCRDQVEDGEIKEDSLGAGEDGTRAGKKQRKAPKGFDKKMTAPGRLVFLDPHYASEDAPGTSAHVHEVLDEDWRQRPGQPPLRVLRLRPIPSGDELAEVSGSQVVPLDSKPSFERAWHAASLGGDAARKLSLYHGFVRHAERCKGQPLFGVFRTLVPGTAPAAAKAYAAEMEAATGRQKDVQPTDGGAPSVTSQGEGESYRSGESPQSTQGQAGTSGTANTARR